MSLHEVCGRTASDGEQHTRTHTHTHTHTRMHTRTTHMTCMHTHTHARMHTHTLLGLLCTNLIHNIHVKLNVWYMYLSYHTHTHTQTLLVLFCAQISYIYVQLNVWYMYMCYHTYTQLNVRSLKAGLRMVPTVASLGRKCAHAFIKHGVMRRLCLLLLADHMATSLKLMALRALDSLADYPQGMEQLLGWSGMVSV